MARVNGRQPDQSGACVRFLQHVGREYRALMKASERQRAIFQQPLEGLSPDDRRFRDWHEGRNDDGSDPNEGSMEPPGPVAMALIGIRADDLDTLYGMATAEACLALDQALQDVFKAHKELIGRARENGELATDDVVNLRYGDKLAHLQNMVGSIANMAYPIALAGIFAAAIEIADEVAAASTPGIDGQTAGAIGATVSRQLGRLRHLLEQVPSIENIPPEVQQHLQALARIVREAFVGRVTLGDLAVHLARSDMRAVAQEGWQALSRSRPENQSLLAWADDPSDCREQHNPIAQPEPSRSQPADSGAGEQRTAPVKSKRSTEKGEGQLKLISALTKHHGYADGGCLNLEPVGNNELARLAEVSESTASTFFNKQFDGHTKYRAICADTGGLVTALKLLNQEFAPCHLFGANPPSEAERDDEE